MESQNPKTIIIESGAEANLNGAQWIDTLEVDLAVWNAMSLEEKDKFMHEAAVDLSGFGTWWEEVGEKL